MPLSKMRGRSHNANGARPRRTHAVRLVEEYGGAERVRTADLRVANATLSQLSYGPMKSMSSCALGRFVVARLRGSALGDGFGIGSARIRTADLRIDPFERQWAPNAVVHRSRNRPPPPLGYEPRVLAESEQGVLGLRIHVLELQDPHPLEVLSYPRGKQAEPPKIGHDARKELLSQPPKATCRASSLVCVAA